MINTDSVLHGFTDLKNLDDLGPIVLNQAKGIYVYDQNGKKYYHEDQFKHKTQRYYIIKKRVRTNCPNPFKERSGPLRKKPLL